MKGVLLINLGSTNSPDPKDVKEYLDEFLMDERAIDLPYWLRSFIVRGIILNTRPKKTAENYQRIWWKGGSPLIVISERLRKKVEALSGIPVEIGMRYGKPSIKEGLQKLVDQGVEDVLLVPLYPQYTMSTIETALVKALEVKKEFFPDIKLSTTPPFYNREDYIEVLSNSIKEHLNGQEYDHLLFSYHGIPVRHEDKTNYTGEDSDPRARKITYREQCLKTTELVAEKLDLQEGTYSTSFQSRLGVDAWIKPFTDKTVKTLAEEGVKKLVMVAPAFVADCIETIDELDREAREDFQAAGGRSFSLVPCLNSRDDWTGVINDWIQNWVKYH